jgi:hypothetical protein
MTFNPYEFEFFVTESEYPKLQAACPGDFPFPYEKFVAITDQRLEKRLEQVTTRKTNINVSEFAAYCTKRGIRPDEKARIIFAQFAGNNQIPK